MRHLALDRQHIAKNFWAIRFNTTRLEANKEIKMTAGAGTIEQCLLLERRQMEWNVYRCHDTLPLSLSFVYGFILYRVFDLP